MLKPEVPMVCLATGGFLFHGPPGSGKTSISTALAGHFKSDLYIASINRIRDDNHLALVFKAPSRGDVLLLEDINSAGIGRENMSYMENRDPFGRRPRTSRGVTLSGLLNAIDSVGGMDGIILIMTSNSPESLDKALIRPGRIDKPVYFGLASQNVAKSIFMRLYQGDNAHDATLFYLQGLAETFASKIPEGKFTPAEIQGFLIEKSTHERALDDVAHWVGEMEATRSAGRKEYSRGAEPSTWRDFYGVIEDRRSLTY